jgi:iron complex outermembrane receptor protein
MVDASIEDFRPSDRKDETNVSGDPARRLFGSTGLEADFWWSLLNLDIIPSARLELSRDVRTGRSSFGVLLPPSEPVVNLLPLPRIGFVQRPTETIALKANVGHYARLPSFTELYGNTGFLVGDTTLRPETAVNGDLGLTVRLDGSRGGVTLDASAFGARVEDLIQFQQDAYGRAHPRNIGSARIAGVETSAEARLSQWARLVAQLTYTDAQDTSNIRAHNGRQLPLRARYRAYLRPELRRLSLGRGFEIGTYADLDMTSGDFLDAANLVEVPARVMFGAGASIDWAPTGLSLVASGQNLGDSRISDVAGFPLPGRAFYLTLAGRLGNEPKETAQ